MTTKHTPTPWKLFQSKAGNATALMVDGYTVAINLSRRDAEFIQIACNAHDELVAALHTLAGALAIEMQVPLDECVGAEFAIYRKALAKVQG